MDFRNLMRIKFCWRLNFEILIIHKPSLCSPTQNYGPISLAVLMFIEYKQTSKVYLKKSSDFDLTMGSYDGAETAEIVGLYVLSKLEKLSMRNILVCTGMIVWLWSTSLELTLKD